MSFDASQIARGKFYSLWVAGTQYAEVKAASAESALTTEDVPIAGELGDEIVVTGGKGTGKLTFHKIMNSDLLKTINSQIGSGLPFVFDLISELNDPNIDGAERVCIDDCQITKFNVIDVDISKLLEQTYEFSYNISKVTFE